MKEIKKNEFRKNNSKKTGGHPTYIYAQQGKQMKFIGITHSKITDGIENIPLDKNPEPGNKSKAYIRPSAERAHKSSFGKKLQGWFFGTKEDKEKVKSVIENSKGQNQKKNSKSKKKK